MRNVERAVVAKGQDLIAKRIREIAAENDVPIVENPPLARTLYKYGEIGREIGETRTDVLGHAHHYDSFGREVATAHVDALGHENLTPSFGGASTSAADPFDYLNSLFNKK